MADVTDKESIAALGLAVLFIARRLAGKDSLDLAQFLLREAAHHEREGIDPRLLRWVRGLGEALEQDRFEVMLRSATPPAKGPN